MRRRFGRSVFPAAIGPEQRPIASCVLRSGLLACEFRPRVFKLGVDLAGILAELRGIFIQKLGLMIQLEDEVDILAFGKVSKGRSLV